MPEGYDGARSGDESERTDDPNEYKRTCIDFTPFRNMLQL